MLSGGLAGAAALALAALGRPAQVHAANGDELKLGQGNAASSLTAVNSSANGFRGRATGAGGIGLIGESTSGTGVGVFGFDNTSGGVGVRGRGAGSQGVGVQGFGPRGVLGESAGASGIGVVARSNATSGGGQGLRALALSGAGHAIYAENSAPGGGGTAITATSSTDTTVRIDNVGGDLHQVGLAVSATGSGVEAEGRIGVLGSANLTTNEFSAGIRGTANHPAHVGGSFRNLNANGTSLEVVGGVKLQGASGKATINNGASSVVVTPGAPVRNASIVLATLQSNAGPGVGVARVQVGSSDFVIELTSAATHQCQVAWLILN